MCEPSLPRHPGFTIEAEIAGRGITTTALADLLSLPETRIGDICLGREQVDANVTLRLGRAFGTSPEFWLKMEASYRLSLARQTVGPGIHQTDPALPPCSQP
jgi:addiction module HigA family antidote